MASSRTQAGSRWLPVAVVNTVTPLGTLQLEVVRVTTDSGLTILLVVTIAHALAAGRRGLRAEPGPPGMEALESALAVLVVLLVTLGPRFDFKGHVGDGRTVTISIRTGAGSNSPCWF